MPLSSVSRSSKLIAPEEEGVTVWAISTGDDLDLCLTGAVLWDRALTLWDVT